MKNTHQSHKQRNAKTSILFTIALAYLVFGGSSLLLVGNLVVGIVKSFIGGDVMVTSFASGNDLPESDLRDYVNEQQLLNDHIENYAFRGILMDKYLDDVFGFRVDVDISSGGDFPINNINLYPVEESFLESALTEYYLPEHSQDGVNFNYTDDKPDFVKSLYSVEGTTDYDGDLDKYNVASRNLSDTSSDGSQFHSFDPTQQIKVIIPEGIKDVLSVEGGDTVKLTIEYNYGIPDITYRLLIRGMPQKMPGFVFMSYKQVQYFLTGIISFPQAYAIANLQSQLTDMNTDAYETYKSDPDNSNYTYYWPKDRLFIQLNPDLDQEGRDIIV